jgi:hypothetical protein
MGGHFGNETSFMTVSFPIKLDNPFIQLFASLDTSAFLLFFAEILNCGTHGTCVVPVTSKNSYMSRTILSTPKAAALQSIKGMG